MSLKNIYKLLKEIEIKHKELISTYEDLHRMIAVLDEEKLNTNNYELSSRNINTSSNEKIRIFTIKKILENGKPVKVRDIYDQAKKENISIPGSGKIENLIISLIRDPENRFVNVQKGTYGIFGKHEGKRVGINFKKG
tara:strand:- start:500 stop:913 length:414 start_codon:yes stop_codon:yes gene_type:complete